MLRPDDAVIFDLDGVLLDTEPLYTAATAEVLGALGHTYGWDLKRRCMGRAARDSAAILVQALGLPLTPEELVARKRPLLERLFVESPAFPGMPELVLALLAERPVALATSTARRLYELKAGPHAFLGRLPVVVTGDHPEVAALKPAPDIFLVAARALGVPPERCVVVEDSPAGVTAARAAGMRVVAVPAPELGDALVAHADVVVRGHHELGAALRGPAPVSG